MNDLKKLFPAAEKVTVGSTSTRIHPVKLKDLENYSQAADALIALLANPTAANLAAYGAKHHSQLADLLRCNTSLSGRQISALSAHDAIMLGYQVVRVNFDFFAQALPAVVASLPDGAGSSSD